MAEPAADVIVEPEQTGPAAEVEGTDEPNSNTGETVGPETMYVTVVYSKGHESVINRTSVLNSVIMKTTTCGPGMWCWLSFLHDVNC